jgi:hypothetical protein
MAAWQLYEANAVYVLRDTYIISVAYRWLGERRTKSQLLPDFPRYKKHKHCDRDLCRTLWGLLDRADIVVAHNGDRFDIKKINSRLIVHGHEPPSSYKTVDTLKVSRAKFKFDSNKADNVARYLNEPRKLTHTGAALWKGCCEDHDPRSWRTMGRYNRRDVDLLVRLYERLKPWMPNHPNLNLYTGGSGCPTCQSSNIKRRGLTYARTTVRQRYQCLDCHAAWSGEIIKCKSESLSPTRRAPTTSRLASAPSRRKNATRRIKTLRTA